MKPDFTARIQDNVKQAEAATTIQNHWRRRSAVRQQKEGFAETSDWNVPQLNDSVSLL